MVLLQYETTGKRERDPFCFKKKDGMPARHHSVWKATRHKANCCGLSCSGRSGTASRREGAISFPRTARAATATRRKSPLNFLKASKAFRTAIPCPFHRLSPPLFTLVVI